LGQGRALGVSPERHTILATFPFSDQNRPPNSSFRVNRGADDGAADVQGRVACLADVAKCRFNCATAKCRPRGEGGKVAPPRSASDFSGPTPESAVIRCDSKSTRENGVAADVLAMHQTQTVLF